MSDCPCPLKEAARDAPEKVAFISHQEECTFSQLYKETLLWSKFFREKGVLAGDRIAAAFRDKKTTFSALLGALAIDASFCPLNFSFPKSLLESNCKKIAPKLYIDDQREKSYPRSFTTPPALLLFTSGSIAPKIAALSLENLLENAGPVKEALKLDSTSRYLASLPLYHVGGLAVFFRTLLARATVTLQPDDPEITHLSYVWTQLYRNPPTSPKLKCILLGGGPVGQLPDRLPLFFSYGMTEMGSLISLAENPQQQNGIYSTGFPLQGRELLLDASQEIKVRGKTLFQGYLEGEKIHLPLDAQGWFSTKDLGTLDSKRSLFILGRKDRMFISGGENIQPEEIERELLLLPYVLEAVVIAQDNPTFGKRPVAFVKLKKEGSLSLEEMRDALMDKLPKFKIPDALYTLKNFPTKGVKIDHKKLLEGIKKMV